MVTVLFFTRQGFSYLKKNDIKVLVLIFSFLLLDKIINFSSFDTSMLLFQSGIVIESYVFLISYKKKGINQLNNDFYNALNFLFLHAIIGYGLYLLFSSIFQLTTAFGYPYRTLFYLFYVTGTEGVARNHGLLWEPGLLQLILNIFLFLSINRNKSPILLVLIVIAIVSTLSTTGFVCLGINYLFYILYNFKKNKKNIIILTIVSVLVSGSLAFIIDNIQEKIGGENISGLVRYRDFLIGIELIKEHPIFGHGLFNKTYLLTKNYVFGIESNLFSNGYLVNNGDVSGGYTNGLLGVFCWYGVPAGIIVLFNFYKNRFVVGKLYKRVLFFLIISFTLIFEPITFTSFFLMFTLSPIVFNYNKQVHTSNIKRKYEHKT